MTSEQIEQRVRELLAKKFSLAPEKITAESRLIEDLNVDSFGALELIFEVEEAFGLKIPDAEVERVRTVQDIVAYVARLIADRKAGASEPAPTTTSEPHPPAQT